MAIIPGILVVAEHFSWRDVQQLFVGRVTIQFDTPAGTFRREFEISAGDLIALAAQVINLVSQQALAHSVPVKQFAPASVEMCNQATNFASGIWPSGG